MPLSRAWIVFAALLLICCAGLSGDASAESAEQQQPVSLQTLVDRTAEGDTIRLAAGTYAGPVNVNKRITIRGDGSTTLVNDSDKSAMTLSADGVQITGLQITHHGALESAAVEVHGSKSRLENLSIRTMGYGIMVRDAGGTVIHDNQIAWFDPNADRPEKKRNGIDLYNAPDTRITDNQIEYMKDGIYMEQGSSETVKGNRISYSRYGIHCMYIHESQVIGNVGEHNFTGAMVMVVKNTVVSDNSFRKQSNNVYAQGILLYDVQDSLVERNVVEGNRVGVYIEKSTGNRVADNGLFNNFVGIQVINADQNTFLHNGFVTNVIESMEKGSSSNRFMENYWDSFQGLDLNHDGRSEIPYAMNPFYQQFIAKNAAYQLFFQSPSMTFLSNLFADPGRTTARDSAPLMRMDLNLEADYARDGRERSAVFTVGMLLLTAALFIIRGGIRK
ncbi:right-handed parallel beta-helix repeat-containing protein [Paenibacillus chibensis]|uniref:right-handed parallel beta-helix repeat-containing protein n=1 Tax=Paenibacillus chibensis TaxID=59846 RepID=UPI000FD87F43|nr:NosD domain-containing protein [Paenibacillus chibensis]MEC0371433.1 NosD domain-containing protein [Paenibacillus chibensis]